ncbi:L10-interacting MYB domain-containing protein [Quillaja saponaria]|uniref:L10-interacting MYB domain-containing protein n=1 Tax=Quillaja saponaria TaxID=32244 RepID=A0AAD7LIB6_QUISA|nr:L10-interacting MYB domain-containing protein [Quillaja saponaria]
MGSENTTTIDRSRTYWTPAMERYFVDLMLFQLHRGNRSGHTFNKQAWTDMLTQFNAKFACQYDKDVLKSRYTNLWKQFNDVRNLLCQSGFSWDENRHMVVADDFVWDNYTKVHPEARPYKTKAVLNFDDLYLIYGYTIADGRYSRSSHDLGFDDEVQGVNLGDGVVTMAPSSNEHPRMGWTLAMDEFFIELMLNQVGRGNKVNNTFNKQAWADMLAMFNAKFGPQSGKRVLRHRYNKLWKYYNDMKALVNQNGFLWDETQKMIVADDDAWDAYIKEQPHARKYRTKTLPSYYHLLEIYGNESEYENTQNSDLHEDKNLEDVLSGEGKGSQTAAGSDRMRTYWTPPMDRFLIDLLFDQVLKGNKLAQTFITQAWNDMVASFNVQFRSHHDKDVLKSRYKHLRRQYTDVKTLLDQKGFQWDEKLEMVTAADNVWDAYTKVHPDARSYRVKTLPSYHKLQFIFGDSSDGIYNRLASEANPCGELPALMTSEVNIDHYSNFYVPSVEWTEQQENYFIGLMKDQISKGNMIDSTFSEQAWTCMTESFNENFRLQCDKQFLEDRYIFLMKQHYDISNLLNNSGFVWDETRQMVVAESNDWEACIKDHPEVILYRNKVFNYYHELCKIFGNVVVDLEVSCQVQGIETNYTAFDVEIDGASTELLVPGNNIEEADQEKKWLAKISSDSERPRKAQKTEKSSARIIL